MGENDPSPKETGQSTKKTDVVVTPGNLSDERAQGGPVCLSACVLKEKGFPGFCVACPLSLKRSLMNE